MWSGSARPSAKEQGKANVFIFRAAMLHCLVEDQRAKESENSWEDNVNILPVAVDCLRQYKARGSVGRTPMNSAL